MNAMNILLLMTDQQRYDCIGHAIDSKVKTPHMDRIAEGMAFSRCQTVNPLCQPARTALLTGRYSRQIGTLSMSGDLNFSIPTFPQALQKAGYWTAGVGKFHYLQTWPWNTPAGGGNPLTRLRPEMQKLGYHHVWETSGKQLAIRNHCDYCDYLEERGLLTEFRNWVTARGSNTAKPDSELEKDGHAWPFGEEHHIDIVTGHQIRAAIAARDKSKPFFVLGSFCSPHKPFDPPRHFLEAEPLEEVDDFISGEDGTLDESEKKTLWRLRRAYKATIRLVDEEVGKILRQLEDEGLMEDTLVLLTSDHGEMMGDHYRVQKSSYFKESLNVPLVIRHPRHLRGGTNDSPVELTDITATILETAGLDPRSALSRNWPAYGDVLPGKSLFPVVRGEAGRVRDYAFAECQNDWQCVVSDRFKYVRFLNYNDPDGPKEALYETTNDPRECRNLIDEAGYAEQASWHRRRLQFVLDHTPPVQQCWAPLMTSGLSP